MVSHELSDLKSAVSSAHPLASQAGVWAMVEGGNAYDAAVATQLALAVVFPSAGNIGGGGFMVARDKEGTTRMLDFRERAPLASKENMYVVGQDSISIHKQFGWLASGIPGTIDGIFAVLPFCKLSVEKLFQPAISLAKYGFTITEKQAKEFNSIQENLKKYNPNISSPFFRNHWQQGDTLRQEKLAATLQRIVENGRDEFYTGKTASILVEQSNQHGGIFQMEDFKKYKSVWREPIHFTYKDYTMIVPPLPSSGGILLAQMFTMLKPFTERYDFSSQTPTTIQIMTEIEKAAYVDRAKHMGDPDFYKEPIRQMLDTNYIKQKIANFRPGERAVPSNLLRFPTIQETEETTHISIVDKEGNAVSVTTTLNGWFGSLVYVEELGFFLNNEMDDFSAKPGFPNMYGAVEGLANKIEPEKRMLSSMTPTIVLKSGKLKYVIGSPGGTTIPTSIFQTLVNLIEHKASPKTAVFSPRFHHQFIPDKIFVEADFSNDAITQLTALGYVFSIREPIGRIDFIQVNAPQHLTAIGDRRGDNSPDGEK